MIQHLACIMDGNRRWAQKRALQTFFGHRKGVESVRRVADYCIKNGIKYLSLYAFSVENFRRTKKEVNYLFNLIATQAQKHVPEFKQKDIRIRFVGDRALFPAHVRPVCDDVEVQTQDHATLQVNILFCYGARQEMVACFKTLLHKIQQGLLSEDQLDDQMILKSLWTADTPEPDLIVRTGGASRKRLSNFLLYQAAYSEFYFTDCLWPDIDAPVLDEALASFTQTQRNFGS